MREIFQLQALFGIAVVAFEVPTGYIGDLFGRKRTLIIGSLINALGFTYLIFIKSINGLILWELILALGLSFVSGADISLLYDSIDKSDRKHGTKSLANMQLASVSGESTAAILGGILVAYSFHKLILVNAMVAWIPFFYFTYIS